MKIQFSIKHKDKDIAFDMEIEEDETLSPVEIECQIQFFLDKIRKQMAETCIRMMRITRE